MSITVASAQTAEERAEVYAFRYRIYVEEMGLQPPGADHQRRQLEDEYDAYGLSYALVEDGAIVGSLRCLFIDQVPDPSALIAKFHMEPALAAFGPSAIVTTSRFMLDPHLRHGTAILQLIQAAYDDAHHRGIRLNYGDCSPHMLEFYEHMGYRRFTRAYNDTFFGFKLPILMLIGDKELFDRVRSPLGRLAAAYRDDVEARDWFACTYPEHLGVETASLLSEGSFFDLLAERVSSDPLHAVALLHDLSREEADRFLAHATLIKAQPGDLIVRQGDRDDTVYILLSGLAEVVLDGDENRPLRALAAGDIFGEIGFLTSMRRTASVVARAPSEILVLSAAFLKRFLKQEPVIAARLLYNLSTILARRLATATLKESTGK
ncbi:MAG TPA: cyclic nucleotide-binding domain-containing protein [Burkholderiales bacterium]|nr:cyclic nucleotide-binding domain-containing protein [Burkholderiales bacterium]